MEVDWDNLPPTTVPVGLSLTAKGFNDPELAKRFGQSVLEIITTVGSFIDLADLDGVTLAVDYDAALAELDRGMEGLRPLSRSNTEEMQGVAMCPAVLRDGEVKSHLIFNAEMLVSLIHEQATADEQSMSIGIIAHECAHVEITARKEASVPDARFGTRIEGYERAVTFQIAEICWDEYAACRLSALFAKRQNDYHADTVISCARTVREEANAAIRSYRLHGDLDRLVGEAGPPLFKTIKAAAYLLGGMDAVAAEWDEFPAVRLALEQASYAGSVDRLHSILRQMWETQDEWKPSLDVFASLQLLAKDVFRGGGLVFQTKTDGSCFIEVPFTEETVP